MNVRDFLLCIYFVEKGRRLQLPNSPLNSAVPPDLSNAFIASLLYARTQKADIYNLVSETGLNYYCFTSFSPFKDGLLVLPSLSFVPGGILIN